MAPSILVIGANRGIGLNLLKAFAERGWDVSATGAKIIDLDYLSESSIAAAAKTYGEGKPLDVLINCAGIGVDPASWEETTAEHMMNKFRVMTVGPFLATKYFLSSLKNSEAGKIINITSFWASLGENDFGEYVSYRAAKAALNMETVTIAHEMKAKNLNITMLALDPGDIPTKLSRWSGNTNMEQSVKGMVKIIEEATVDISGSFLRWNGEKLQF
ncbi:uncharacterized protein N7518_001736 [Penicillium psychrosexuale]|uniref:uncharacterized protein n=1 Tax=Penicillium psychrosexuale TaxID=1002107 RepID=UPI0025458F7A|nr:uncharacterized protein N7518_001736 [Penicillium psychrosexuale]KAJ5799668.1 hypothetical protein N7518_001736 [Penicillium psychrosexuale]